MSYNVYVIVADILTSMLCGAIAILLFFQLRRDNKTRIFLVFVTLECLAAASFTIARIVGLLGANHFQLFFYTGTLIYSVYPSVLLCFTCEFFGLWTAFKRHLVRWLLLLPVLMCAAGASGVLFYKVYVAASGSFHYEPSHYAVLITGIGEACLFYTLILVLQHAYRVKLQSQRQLIFGVMVLLVTALVFPSGVLFRTFGALGTIVSMLFVTGSVLRYRLFDPLTQLNTKLLRRTRKLRKAMRQNEVLLTQVQQADQAKIRFIGYISHEVRNSISTIFMTAQTITEHKYLYQEALPDEYHTDLLRIRRQAEHVKGLIDDLLDMSRIEAGTLKVSVAALDPVPILSEVQQVMSAQLQADVTFQRRYAERLPAVCADKMRLTQILMNLVGNAAKFTAQGTISLAADIDKGFLRFQVADTGIGMSEHVLSHLFQPYMQDAREVNQPRRGTGLGLTISKQLIEVHGGTIQVTSKEGAGTIVAFTIPLAEPDTLPVEACE